MTGVRTFEKGDPGETPVLFRIGPDRPDAPVAVAASRADEITEGTELLKNPTFERKAEGWMLRGAVPEPELRHGESASVRLDGVEPGEQSWSHAGVVVSPVPVDRELRFECQVRGHDDGQKVAVNVFGYDKDQDLTFLSSNPFDLANGKWTKLTQEYVVPPARRASRHGSSTRTPSQSRSLTPISGWAARRRPGRGFPRSRRMRRRRSRLRSAPLDGPGVIRAKAQAAVAARGNDGVGVLTFPIPGTYRDQVPLTFDLHVEPPTAPEEFPLGAATRLDATGSAK